MWYTEEEKAIVRRWLGETIHVSDYWINHNVKYDAHVCTNEFGIVPACNLICTQTLAKLIDSDRITRGGYGLDALSKSWLGEDISKYEAALQPYLKRNKDYGRIPPDILGEYGGQDILTNRRLWGYIAETLAEQCYNVRDTEIQLTRRLYQMERNGLRVEPQQLRLAQLQLLNRMSQIDDELTQIVGRSFRPHVNEDCFDVLCTQYGLPILAYTKDDDGEETGNPSFDKAALVMYEAHPQAPPGVVQCIREFRQWSQIDSLFLTPWQELVVDGYLHSSYNQCVRTGRMSCSDPNAQQLNDFVKQLILPKPGYKFISADYSQIEFRFIVHYIKDERCIKAYHENPDTDFHIWVAQMCGIPRKPAKSVNFGIAFGEGKKKLTKQLSMQEDLVAGIRTHIKALIENGQLAPERETDTFQTLASRKAESVLATYHASLPTLKPTMRDVERALRAKGYVYNMYGRRRHLPIHVAYRGFNTLNQSSAADLMKERFVELCNQIDGTPIETQACVHDENLLQAPAEIVDDARTLRDIVGCMETLTIPLRVPVRASIGTSGENWKLAGKTAQPLQFAHLR
jgi:DNA polymerase-1